MELGLLIPLAALVISMGAIVISALTHRQHAHQSYVEELEGRIVLLETRIRDLTEERSHFITEIALLRDENHRLRVQVERLQKRVDGMP